jgi:excisionase family DNA binding protein
VSDRLFTAEEIGERLGVPRSWVLESARSGAIPHIRLGRYVRFDLNDVDAWIQECKSPGRPVAFRTVNPKGAG